MSSVRCVILLLSFTLLVCCARDDSFQIVKPVNDEIITVFDKPEGIPAFYRTEIEGKKIDFFAIRLNGELRVFLNRCRKCFNSGLGFRFEDGFIRCRTCNVTYPVKEISRGIGSCYPISVKSSSEARRLHINVKDLLSAMDN